MKALTRILPLWMCAVVAGCASLGGAPKDDGNQVQAQVAQADNLAAQGRYADAYQQYAAVLNQAPNNADAHQKAGEMALKMDNPDAAQRHFESARAAGGNRATSAKSLGKAYLVKNQPNQAIVYFNEAVQMDPSPQNFANLAVAYDLIGNSAEAQRLYRQALLQAPQDLDIRGNMALSMLLSGNQQGAIDVLQSVVASPAANANHYVNMGLVYGMSGKTGAARRILSKVLSEDDVEKNMRIYDEMQTLSPQSLREAVLNPG